MEKLLETSRWWTSAMRTWTHIFKKGKTNANRHLNTRPTSCIWRKVPKFTSARARTFTFQIIIRDKILGAEDNVCEIGEVAVRMRYEKSEKMLIHRRKSCALCVPARFLGPKISACKIVYVFVEIMHAIWFQVHVKYGSPCMSVNPLAKYLNT